MRQRRRVFGQIDFIYSAAYCLFALVHVANARQIAGQLPHRSPDSIASLSAKPDRLLHLIFLHSLVSEQAPDFLILPSLFLMSFSFPPPTPPTGTFPITSESSHL